MPVGWALRSSTGSQILFTDYFDYFDYFDDLDDLDGTAATKPVTYALQGSSSGIDFNDEHAASIEESFAEWIGAARKVSARGAAAPTRSSASRASSGTWRNNSDDVRGWARANGNIVADRDRKQSALHPYDGR